VPEQEELEQAAAVTLVMRAALVVDGAPPAPLVKQPIRVEALGVRLHLAAARTLHG